ncbi:hypothetical protein LSTR_LSTR006765 [Laodelphax striatellus]|uniref:Peptidase S1 domain-containing protein n=1 Tax=Laodelphax striatellus TaxID=195883 RepID=A0A482XE48_LAOST|nr:hypothetical protein LSTR_LSTR006765 [Laodelphax striatellus]
MVITANQKPTPRLTICENEFAFTGCIGAIISTKFILTAAHCQQSDPSFNTTVVAGELDLSRDPDCDTNDVCPPSAKQFKVEKFIPQPEYVNDMGHDIALAKIEGEFEFDDEYKYSANDMGHDIALAKIEGEFEFDDSGTNETSDSYVLQKITMTIQGTKECNEHLGIENDTIEVDAPFLCAGGQPEQRIDYGDSGGVLAIARTVDDDIPSITTVVAGELDLSRDPDCDSDNFCPPSAKQFKVEKFIPHPEYANDILGIGDDIALVKIEGEFEYDGYIAPLCLEYGPLLNEDYAGDEAEFAGWGTFKIDPDTFETLGPNVLQKTLMPVQGAEDCNEAFKDLSPYLSLGIHTDAFKLDAFLCAGGQPEEALTVCTGGIISKKFVLTAAHCQPPNHTYTATVLAGELDTSRDPDCDTDNFCPPSPKHFKVEKFIPNRIYDPWFGDDIALVKIEGEFEFDGYIGPLCLEYGPLLDEDYAGDEAEFAGWGAYKIDPVTFEGTGPSVLQKITMPVQDAEGCYQELEYLTLFFHHETFQPEAFLCAGGRPGQHIYYGDS